MFSEKQKNTQNKAKTSNSAPWP